MDKQLSLVELIRIDPMRFIISFSLAGVIALLFEILFDIEMPLKELITLALFFFIALWMILSMATVIVDVVNPDIGTLSKKLNKRLTFTRFLEKLKAYENNNEWRDAFIDSCINQYVQWEGLINNIDRISDYHYTIIIRNIKHPKSLAKANISIESHDKNMSKLEIDKKIRLRAHLRLDYEIPYLYKAKIIKIS